MRPAEAGIGPGVVPTAPGGTDRVRVPVGRGVVFACIERALWEVGLTPRTAARGAADDASPHCHVLPLPPGDLRPNAQGRGPLLLEADVELRPPRDGHHDLPEIPVVRVGDDRGVQAWVCIRIALQQHGEVTSPKQHLELLELLLLERPVRDGPLGVVEPRLRAQVQPVRDEDLLAPDGCQLDISGSPPARPVLQRVLEHSLRDARLGPGLQLQLHALLRPSFEVHGARATARLHEQGRCGWGAQQHVASEGCKQATKPRLLMMAGRHGT
mmetsp:Transcript_38810/g.105075  ORF Transcript_38810/g.105075 Transcript_38810/m.105075 type:complete len:270 (-) Transcript_38810:43-852(-)